MKTNNIAFLEQQLNKSERRVGLLSKKNSELQEEITKHQNEIQQLSKPHLGYSSAHHEFEANERAKIEAHANEAIIKAAASEEKLQLAHQRIKELESTMQNLSTQETNVISNLAKRNEELDKENKMFSLERNNLKKEALECQQLVAFYKKNVEDAENVKNFLAKTIATLQNELQNQKDSQLETTKNFLQERATILGEVARLKGENELIEKQKAKFKLELAQKQERIEQLERRESQFSLNSAIGELQTQLQEITRENSELRIDREAFQSQMVGLEHELKERNNFYVKRIQDLQKVIEEQDVKLIQQNKELSRLRIELDNEKSLRSPLDTFKFPLLHKERLNELTDKLMQSEEKYLQEVQRSEKLLEEIASLKNELKEKVYNIFKKEQESLRSNYSRIINNLEISTAKNKQLEEANRALNEELKARRLELYEMHAEISDLTSRMRAYTIENQKLKIELLRYNPDEMITLMPAEEIDSIKDQEIRDLRARLAQLDQQFRVLQDSRSDEFSSLKAKYDEIQKLNETYESRYLEVLGQLRIYSDIKRIEELIADTGSSNKMEQENSGPAAEKEISARESIGARDFRARKLEFENFKKRLSEENSKLAAENKTMHINLKVAQLKFEDLQTKYQVVGQFEKDIENYQQIINARNQTIGSLVNEKEQISRQIMQLTTQNLELSDKIVQVESQIKFYEEYSERLSRSNKKLLEEKEVFIKTIIECQTAQARAESQSKAELARVTEECLKLRNELASQTSLHAIALKKHEDSTLLMKTRVENQDVAIETLIKKVDVQNQIIRELNQKVEDLLRSHDTNLKEDLNMLADMNSILFKSTLSAEDYKNLESLKELLSQQKKQYEETLRGVMQSQDEISEKFFALLERYQKEQERYEKELELQTKEKLEITKNYEAKFKELEQKAQQARDNERMEEEKSTGQDDKSNGQLFSLKEVTELRDTLERERQNAIELRNRLVEEQAVSKKLLDEKLQLAKSLAEMEKTLAVKMNILQMRELGLQEEKKVLKAQIEQIKAEEISLRNRLRALTENMEGQGEDQEMEEEQQEVAEAEGEAQEENEAGREDEMNMIAQQNENNLVIELESLREENMNLYKIVKSLEETLNHMKNETKSTQAAVDNKQQQILEENYKFVLDQQKIIAAQRDTLNQQIRKLEAELKETKEKNERLEKNWIGNENTSGYLQNLPGVTEKDIALLKQLIQEGKLLKILENAKTMIVETKLH